MSPPVVSVVVPTRDRAGYLDVTLRSLAAQDLAEPHELIVVEDGATDATADVVARYGARLVRPASGSGPNTARNVGIEVAGADLIALVDDDVFAPPGWLRAVVEGAARHPDADAYGGPIRARLEGRPPRACGREQPPITTLDLGHEDREAELVWSANMALRRGAFDRVGPFDPRFSTGGDEEEWLRRLRADGGRVMYLAGAGLDHRRAGDDARLRSLMRSAYRRGRNMRAYDAMRHTAPALPRELRVLAGCGWHTVRRVCPQGLIMGAHSAGRLVETVRPRTDPGPPGPTPPAAGPHVPANGELLTGLSGGSRGPAHRLLCRAGDLALDGRVAVSGAARRLDRAAAGIPRRNVLILSVYRPPAVRLQRALDELGSTRHATRVALGSMGRADPALAGSTIATELGGGKFQNLNTLLEAAGGEPADWTLVVDDDVVLPSRFLDRFLAVCERMDLALAQPAQSLTSFAAWPVTRRQAGSLARETRFVEIGPVTCFRRDVLAELAPFAELRYGWGLDLHWSALALDRGWRLGVVDAVPVRHEDTAVGASYSKSEAIEEARSFLAERPFVPSGEAQEVVRSLPLSAPLP